MFIQSFADPTLLQISLGSRVCHRDASSNPPLRALGIYGEIGLTSLNYSEPGYALSPSGAVRVIVGADLAPNLALEGMAAFGTSEGSLAISGVLVKGKVDTMYGVYLKPKTKISDAIEVFGRVGFASAKATFTAPGFAYTTSGNDFSYGVGANFNVAKNASVGLDYMSYYNKTGVSVNGMTINIGFKF